MRTRVLQYWPEGEAAGAVLSQLGLLGLKGHMQRFYDSHRTWLYVSQGSEKNIHVEETMLTWQELENTVLPVSICTPVPGRTGMR